MPVRITLSSLTKWPRVPSPLRHLAPKNLTALRRSLDTDDDSVLPADGIIDPTYADPAKQPGKGGTPLRMSVGGERIKLV